MKTIKIESSFWVGNVVYGIAEKPITNLIYEIEW